MIRKYYEAYDGGGGDTQEKGKVVIDKGDLLKIFRNNGEQTMYRVVELQRQEVIAHDFINGGESLFIQVFNDATLPKEISQSEKNFNAGIDAAIRVVNGHYVNEGSIDRATTNVIINQLTQLKKETK